MFLKFKINQALKTRKHPKPTAYAVSKSIGIIINVAEDMSTKSIAAFIKLLQDEGKKVEVLCYLNNKDVPNFPFGFNHYSSKDFNWYAKLTSPSVKKFINSNFDFLFSLDLSQTLAVEYVLASSKAECRVGPFIQNKKDLYELMVQPTNKSIDSLFSHLYYYCKKIS